LEFRILLSLLKHVLLQLSRYDHGGLGRRKGINLGSEFPERELPTNPEVWTSRLSEGTSAVGRASERGA